VKRVIEVASKLSGDIEHHIAIIGR